MFTLRPINDSDIGLLTVWLNKDYILKWYRDADDWLHEIKERNGTFSWINHFIVLYEKPRLAFASITTVSTQTVSRIGMT